MDIPIDILREIFLQCLSRSSYIPPTPTEPRLVLSHVCSTWRDVALDTPRLWSDIIIDNPRRNNFDVVGYPILFAWLSRSCPCPISLQISYTGQLHHILDDLIFPNLYRCRSLVFNASDTSLQRVLSLPAGVLSDLKRIEIIAIGNPRIIRNLVNDGSVIAFQSSPKLRHVVFSFYAKNVDVRRLHFPWKQLSVLVFRWSSISAICCLSVLRECTALGECEVSISEIDASVAENLTKFSTRPVVLPSLHTLHLQLVGFRHHTAFLAALHLPNLRTFSPLNKYEGFIWSPPALELFLRPSSFQLSCLILSLTTHALGDTLYHLLILLPHLTELHLPMQCHLFGNPFHGLRTGRLSPRVTSIRFGPISFDTLIYILEGRLAASQISRDNISAFTSVWAHTTAPTKRRKIARIAALRAAGVVVHFMEQNET
ncbi:hypothetical protein BD779DRAFT_1677939 [Infundibulicybe gibba]|nr:hypothetical protein BD779DRAFT_1677939 [Infundibulicybe gibba]